MDPARDAEGEAAVPRSQLSSFTGHGAHTTCGRGCLRAAGVAVAARRDGPRRGQRGRRRSSQAWGISPAPRDLILLAAVGRLLDAPREEYSRPSSNAIPSRPTSSRPGSTRPHSRPLSRAGGSRGGEDQRRRRKKREKSRENPRWARRAAVGGLAAAAVGGLAGAAQVGGLAAAASKPPSQSRRGRRRRPWAVWRARPSGALLVRPNEWSVACWCGGGELRPLTMRRRSWLT